MRDILWLQHHQLALSLDLHLSSVDDISCMFVSSVEAQSCNTSSCSGLTGRRFVSLKHAAQNYNVVRLNLYRI